MSKNILFVCGILPGHFTGCVEIARELISLGHNVTCYVLDEFVERMKVVDGVKVVEYKVDRDEIKKYRPAGYSTLYDNIALFGKSFENVISLLYKEETKYDYYIFDAFFDVKEMNKLFNIPLEKYIILYVSWIFTDENPFDVTPTRRKSVEPLNKKYNLNLREFVENYHTPNEFKKLILTSKFFHFKPEKLDNTCYFIGPNLEKRKFDENFPFKKDKSKKLIYISCGTVFNIDVNHFKTIIDAFKNSDEYQLLIALGQRIELDIFKDIPKNVSIFNFVPQSQIFKDIDIFISHGGLNSVQESILCGVPLIVIPQKYDQFDIAKRLEALEAGIYLDHNKATPEAIREAVKKIDDNREKYKKGIELIKKSLIEAKNDRTTIYKKIFV
jgi:MGT family glycosyltransferase